MHGCSNMGSLLCVNVIGWCLCGMRCFGVGGLGLRMVYSGKGVVHISWQKWLWMCLGGR